MIKAKSGQYDEATIQAVREHVIDCEIWKDIDGYEGYYQISSFGRARSLDRVITLSNGKTRIVPGKILKMGYRRIPRKTGKILQYSCFNLCKGCKKDRKTGHTHILVAKAFIENPNGYPQINHKDGNGINNHVSNLEWTTSSENQLHAYRMGFRPPNFGEKHGGAKLSESQVSDIRSLRNKMLQKDVAKKYNVSRGTINRIWYGKNWVHSFVG